MARQLVTCTIYDGRIVEFAEIECLLVKLRHISTLQQGNYLRCHHTLLELAADLNVCLHRLSDC
ncbi:hypothetical protein J6590_088965 [Homalodisca vitripennis]|nr:hypothetical protein J6590_088965 [Homalodisca vitripennis]